MKSNPKEPVQKTGHIYDGIEELDHPSPPWFNALFFGTVIIGAIYFSYYTLGDGPTLTQEYEAAKGASEYADYERKLRSGGPKRPSESELSALLSDVSEKKKGATLFQSKCASCHGAEGQGGIGPNLTDQYWIHGAKLVDIYATIFDGVSDKGMLPWGSILSPEEIRSLVVFVRSLAGTKPARAKAPQGVLVSDAH